MHELKSLLQRLQVVGKANPFTFLIDASYTDSTSTQQAWELDGIHQHLHALRAHVPVVLAVVLVHRVVIQQTQQIHCVEIIGLLNPSGSHDRPLVTLQEPLPWRMT